MKKTNSKKFAFTLVELMVAMAIIGVLLGLAVFGVSAAQRGQRNTERRAALQDINLGIQAYIDNYGIYPNAVIFDNATNAAYVGQTGITVACANASTCVKVPLKGSAKPVPSNNSAPNQSKSDGTKYFFNAACVGGYRLAVCVEGNAAIFDVGTCTDASGITCIP